VEGGGKDLQWRAWIGGQPSAPTCWESDVCASSAARRACRDGEASCACRPECDASFAGVSSTTSYAPPSLREAAVVDGEEASTRGGSLVELAGANLGTFGVSRVDLLPLDRRSPACDRVAASRSAATECTIRADATHERIVCTAPEGMGAVVVVVDVNGQCVSASAPLEYAPPRLRDDSYTLPTVGGALNLYGANLGAPHLGARPQVLRLDPAAGATTSSSARDIVVAHHDHIFVELRVPPGVGGGMGLALRIDDATTNAVAFAYAPPVLDAIVPAIADATGDVLTLAGANFGIEEPSASGSATGANASSSFVVRVRGAPCEAAWISDRKATCAVGRRQVGSANVTIEVAGQRSAALALRLACPDGHEAGETTQLCEPIAEPAVLASSGDALAVGCVAGVLLLLAAAYARRLQRQKGACAA